MPGVGVVLVAVDAAELHGPAVDEQPSARTFTSRKPTRRASALSAAVRVERGDGRVEVGRLRRPEPRELDPPRGAERVVSLRVPSPGIAGRVVERGACETAALGVVELGLDGAALDAARPRARSRGRISRVASRYPREVGADRRSAMCTAAPRTGRRRGRCRSAATCPGPRGSCRRSSGRPRPRAGSRPAQERRHVELGRREAALAVADLLPLTQT